MSSSPGRQKSLVASVVAAGVVGLAFVVIKYRNSIFRNIRRVFLRKDALFNQHIEVINTREECKRSLERLYRGCSQYKVLGFDCEWVTLNGSRHPVALLQLASHDGFCALFRLSKIRCIPDELKAILEDLTILKVGVAPVEDAKHLLHDYDVDMNGTIDLRYLALSAMEKPEGLSSMAMNHLNIKLDKNWRIRCSNWEAESLNEKQLKYAASDAHVAVEIFKKLTDKICTKKHGIRWNMKSLESRWKDISEECFSYSNVRYKQKHHQKNPGKIKNLYDSVDLENIITDTQKASMNQPNFKQPKRSYQILTRSKPLYQNCYMQKQNGDILCTCDLKKARWYVEKELATVVDEDPFTIRLNFKPAGESVQDVDKYYQIPRENRCVVCGKTHSYIRKNVVPREYRKLFPIVMKSHTCHDVLLLCGSCHQISNSRDQFLRLELSIKCNAPYSLKESKYLPNQPAKKVASAAKALLESTRVHNIPEDRRNDLQNEIRAYFGEDREITEDLLREAYQLNSTPRENPAYESHGQKVVAYYSNIPGGLLQLEELWRKHFLDSMKPKFMPDLWSISHNKSRLEIRATEGRLQQKDIQLAGFTVENHFSNTESNSETENL